MINGSHAVERASVKSSCSANLELARKFREFSTRKMIGRIDK